MRRHIRDEKGYTYVMVLAAVVVLAIMAQTVYTLMSYEIKRDREKELLFRGMAYQRAIRDYYLYTPPGQTPSYPRQLEDLISDPRVIHQRYLRTLYTGPDGCRMESGSVGGRRNCRGCQSKPGQTYPTGKLSAIPPKF